MEQTSENRDELYLVCQSKAMLNLFTVNIQTKPKVTYVKRIALVVDCLCSCLWDPNLLYIAQGPKLTQVALNMTGAQKLQTKDSFKYTANAQATVTALRCTFLR